MNKSQRAPEQPLPNIGNAMGTRVGARPSRSIWPKVRTIVLSVLILVAFAAIMYGVYARYKPEHEPVTYIHSEFIDLDGDGDLDYLKDGVAIFNCGGVACQLNSPINENPFTQQQVIPTPQVYAPSN